MYFKTCLICVVTGLFCRDVIAGNHHVVTVYGGQLNYKGAVVSAPCSVSIDSQNQLVTMGQVRVKEFDGIGSWSQSQAFTIKLEDCDTDLAPTAGVLLKGITDGKDPQVFATEHSQGSAKGVGIGIFDSQGNLIIPNSAPITFMSLIDGNNTISFSAKYRATENTVLAGSANAAISFEMVYQ
ncbi:fimbrial protein [Hafnia alvei]|nr:fimbrial protein [Hafnia alvei]QQE43809.1 fimbrial protein [Hafnia alvei]